MSERKGILAAGNWIIDEIKIIDEFPHQDGLANILAEKNNNGGSPYNLLKDLSYLDAPFPLQASGLVGNDEKGAHILEDCRNCSIDTGQLLQTDGASTSYTAVMSVMSTGRRTFFHQRGANALFGPEHIDFGLSDAKIFHMAYLLLLDRMDQLEADGRTVASRVFELARKRGFITSTDIVSEASNRFAALVPPCLPYIDYLFLNEYEAFKLTGIDCTPSGAVDLELAEQAAHSVFEMGVSKLVILHFPEGAMAYGAHSGTVVQPSVMLPVELIKGSAGAGDAFAAGVLLGLHEDYGIRTCLELGVCAAAASLFDESCSSGLEAAGSVTGLGQRYGYRSL